MDVVVLMKLGTKAYAAYNRRQRQIRIQNATPKLPDPDRFDDLRSATPTTPSGTDAD
jgi:hypothetical protein